MKVLIGTKNPGKIEGARRALEHYYNNVEVVGISAPSNVSEQPVGLETYEGALNRVNNLTAIAKENKIEADLFMAVESGLTSELGFWAISNIAVIANNKGEMGYGASSSFPVPNKYVEEIKADAGLDIGDTLIGMHLKKVAVPVRLSIDKIGEAHLTSARVRPKFIGGIRAIYNEEFL